MLTARRSLSRSQSLAALGLGLIIAVTFVALRDLPASRSAEALSGQVAYGIAQVPGQGPFTGGDQAKVSLAQALDSAPYHIFRPEDRLASDKTITEVWTATLGEEKDSEYNVAFEYESGLEVLIKPAALSDPRSAYSNIVEEGGFGRALDINGFPALLISQGSDGTGENPGSVDMVLDGVQVSIIGHLADDDLLGIAQSLR